MCDIAKPTANVLASCSPPELKEKLSLIESFLHNLTTFPSNQVQPSPQPIVALTVEKNKSVSQLECTSMDTSQEGKPVQHPGVRSVGTDEEDEFVQPSTNIKASQKLSIPLIKSKRGRPRNVKVVKRRAPPHEFAAKKICLSMVDSKFLPLCKSYSLSDIDLGHVACNMKLSDSVVNVAQHLIHKKFPRWGGFQDVLLGKILKFSRTVGPFIQILHTTNPDHWITVSNIEAPSDSLFIYDSIDQPVPPDAIKQACNILKPRCANIKIFVKPVQDQGCTLDCGLFAIANMYCIASGKDPTKLSFRQDILRSHLLKCITGGVIEDFPTTATLVPRVRAKDFFYGVHCLCRQPLLSAGDSGIIQCASCTALFHETCLRCKIIPGIPFVCSQSCGIAITSKKAH